MSQHCTNPVKAYICGTVRCKSDGIRSANLVFSPNAALLYFQGLGLPPSALDANSIDLPCGKCVNCLMRKRKDLAVRIAHEASLHDFNSFITLTYRDECLPRSFTRHPTLSKYDAQCFLKRLRRRLEYHNHVHGLRYYLCGEYGSKTQRPHYHLVIFGWKPDDLYAWKSHNGRIMYRSPLIESCWRSGLSVVEDVGSGVAKYVASYVTKKYTHLVNESDQVDIEDFCRLREDEFSLASKRDGGIGAPWFDLFGEKACLRGLTSVRNGDKISSVAIPLYYWFRLRRTNPDLWCQLRDSKRDYILAHVAPVDYDAAFRSSECSKELLKYQANKEII